MNQLVENISDTARWVAFFRAEESERPDAVFHDPFARRLAGEKGEQIANAIGFSRKNSWSFVARTYLLNRLDDEMKTYAAYPEPPGPRRPFPWSGDCLFENMNKE
jgi:O-methyltransferase involved in polyketide biosynthesis